MYVSETFYYNVCFNFILNYFFTLHKYYTHHSISEKDFKDNITKITSYELDLSLLKLKDRMEGTVLK